MTADIQRQIAAAKGQKVAPKPRTPVISTLTPPQPPALIVEPEIIEDETPSPAKAATHYIGPYQLAIANGTHFPGRMRCVLTGPSEEFDKLLAHLQAYKP